MGRSRALDPQLTQAVRQTGEEHVDSARVLGAGRPHLEAMHDFLPAGGNWITGKGQQYEARVRDRTEAG